VHHWLQVLAAAGLSPSAAVSSTGNTLPFLVGRVSYAFGLQGPCTSTDTACSSSLVAAHMGHTGEVVNTMSNAYLTFMVETSSWRGSMVHQFWVFQFIDALGG